MGQARMSAPSALLGITSHWVHFDAFAALCYAHAHIGFTLYFAGACDMGWREKQAFFDQLANSWEAMERPDMLARLTDIITGLGIPPAARVLDVGCGAGVLFGLLRPLLGKDGWLVGLDISRRMLRHAVARGGADLCIQADAEHPPLRDRTFDWIICNAVFPHFTDSVATLRALRRCLTSNGTLVICHANGREAINAIYRQAGGAVAQDCLPDPAALTVLLRQAGLHPVHVVDSTDRYVVIAQPARE